jgi:hypothetical protein
MPVDPQHLSETVSDLLRRHGRRAVERAEENARSLSATGDYPALDLALMVLTEVERHQGSSSTPVT